MIFGGASRDRTDDLIVANDALSQLSYSPTIGRNPSILPAGADLTKRQRAAARASWASQGINSKAIKGIASPAAITDQQQCLSTWRLVYEPQER